MRRFAVNINLTVVCMLHACLFETCSSQNQNMSIMILCRTFAKNDTAHAICNTHSFNMLTPSTIYMNHGDDPCSAPSTGLLCDKFGVLSPTSCLLEKSAGIIETVISSIPASVTSVEMLLLQTRDDDFQPGLEMPEQSGNLTSLKAVSLVMKDNYVKFYIVSHVLNKKFLSTLVGFYDSMVLRRIVYFEWASDSIPRARWRMWTSGFYHAHGPPFTLPLNEKDIFLVFPPVNDVSPAPAPDPGGVFIIVTLLVCSGTLLLCGVMSTVIWVCYRRQQLPWITDGSQRCLEAYRPGLMVVYAYGDQVFNNQSFFIAVPGISYHAIGNTSSCREILDAFKTKPRRTCVTLVTPNYLQQMTTFLAGKDCDEERCKQWTSFHLSPRTVPVLVGDINVQDFPDWLRTVYFKLNRWSYPQYPTDTISVQDILRQIYARSHAFRKYSQDTEIFCRSHGFINWSEYIEVQLKMSYDRVKILRFQGECDPTKAFLQQLFYSNSLFLNRGDNLGIAESVHTVMAYICREVAKEDNILAGTLVGVGSFWDGTRVGQAPTEFDYMYILSDVNKYISECYECGMGKYRLKCNEMNPLSGVPGMLSNFAVRELFCFCIDRSMKRITLPKNLHHGGVLSPYFSGVRRNGPAITLLFGWTGEQYRSKPLLISVDLTIAIRPIHLQAFIQDESTLSASLQFQSEQVAESYLIADANVDNVWQRTTAKLEVSLISNMAPVVTNTIKMLKMLNNLVLTIPQPGGNSHVNGQMKQHGKSTVNDVMKYFTKYRKISAAKGDESSSFNLVKISTSSSRPFLNPASDNINEVISTLVAARNLYFAQACSDGKGEPQLKEADGKAIDLSGLASKLCQLLLNDSEEVSGDSSYFLEQETSVSSEQYTDLDSPKLSYITDSLSCCQCRLLLEDCKPLITLKSCIFKYALIELLQVREASWQDNEIDDSGLDLDLLVGILKKIQKSKQLQHPVLGYPILTYSVSPRVQHCAGQNRRLAHNAENRLSEIMYDVLGLLIETLDSKCQSCDTVVTTRI